LHAIKTNLGCELPCWWGITPGKTTWAKMADMFVKQGIGFYQEGQLDLGLAIPENYSRDTIDVAFQKENNQVQGINIKTEYYYLLAEQKYSGAWGNFTLDRILTRYGIPTQVYLLLTTGAADWSPGMQGTYDLWVEYANKGVAIRYPGELIHENQGWYSCPVFGNVGGIEIRLQSPEFATPLSEKSGFYFSAGRPEL
jgi:hypothetical protein